jgi:hypothetical protein
VKQQSLTRSARFTYGLDRLNPRASTFRGPPAEVNYIFNIVIGLSHVCCYNVLYFLNNPSVIFLTQLHSITRYCTIVNSSRYAATKLWNELPSHFRTQTSFNQFKNLINSWNGNSCRCNACC